jgi:hypothetical protein
MNENLHPQYSRGLMSRSVGSPIMVNLPPSIKPPPGHINRDKEQIAAQRRYEEQQRQQQEAQEGGGMSIICTRCHELGLMSDEVYTADETYGAAIQRCHPEFMAWYRHHAQPIVNRMHCNTRASRIFTRLFWRLFVKPWSEQMAYEAAKIGKGNLFGKFLMGMGIVLFVLTEPVGNHSMPVVK